MAAIVLSPEASTIRGRIIRYQLSDRGRDVRTLIAHSISLTPGTLSVDVDDRDGALLVHVIRAEDEADARDSIAALERRAIAAFAPRRPTEATRS